MEWIGASGDRPICWFSGPAGFGKSAVAQTVAEQCAKAGMLAASFFFSRGAGNRTCINGFIPTLSYQLTLSLPHTKMIIQTALQNDPTIPHQSLEDQLEKLLINPTLALHEPIRPLVVIIDALDECDNKDNIAEFIKILLRTSQDRRLPFLFFMTGRAENHILQRFSPCEAHAVTYCLALQDFDAHVDIHIGFNTGTGKPAVPDKRVPRVRVWYPIWHTRAKPRTHGAVSRVCAGILRPNLADLQLVSHTLHANKRTVAEAQD
jgi:hypothetical protein